MLIHVYSSSSVQEQTASNSLEDDDYVMEGESQEDDSFSYSTEIPDENPDDEILVEKPVDEKPECFAKTSEFSRENTPEKNRENPARDDIRFSDIQLCPVRWGNRFRNRSGIIRWLLLNTIKAEIFLLCVHMAIMINKNYYDRKLIVPEFTLESASVFPVLLDPFSNSTERNITAGWNMIFNVKNPSENHVLSYSDISADVYFGKNPLHHLWPLLPGLNKFTPPSVTAKSIWETVVPGFTQTEAHQDLVKVTFASFPVSVDNTTATSLVKDIDSGTSWGFSVRLHGNITQNNPADKELDRETGSFRAQCQPNMVFLQTGGVMATSSQECKVVTGGLDSWMVLVISVAVVHATLRTCFYFSGKYLGVLIDLMKPHSN